MIKQKNKKGFTLVELLIVIAIIGILAGVVMVNSKTSVEKAKRVSALSTASSTLPELVTCGDDGGSAKSVKPVAGEFICCTSATDCSAGKNLDGHSESWTDVQANTGWQYFKSAGDVQLNSYAFQITGPAGSTLPDIKCSMESNGCCDVGTTGCASL